MELAAVADLTNLERRRFERRLQMGEGYILDFSNRNFADFVYESTGREIYEPRYKLETGSKANRLRAFWLQEANYLVGKLLNDLLGYCQEEGVGGGDQDLHDSCVRSANRLLQNAVGTLEEKIGIRQRLLGRVYDETAGNVQQLVLLAELASQLGISREATRVEGKYLVANDFLKRRALGSGMQVSITHEGVKMIESGRLRTSDSDTRLKVFLCHASDDKNEVRDLYQRLREGGANPWLDEESLVPGQNWEGEVKRSLRESHVVIACLSDRAIRKTGFVQKEIKFALDFLDNQPEGVIYLMPAKLEPCDFPGRLEHLHAVRIYRDGGYEKLLGALNSRAKALGLKSLVNKQGQMKNRLRMLRQKPQGLQEPYK